MSPLRRRLCASGAALWLAGMLTGFWVGAAYTGRAGLTDAGMARGAHLNALFGGLWLVAVGLTLDQMRYGETGRRRLALAVMVPAWANWLVTLVKSGLGVHGIAYTGDAANDAIAALLHVLVVAPGVVASGFWLWGFRPVQAGSAAAPRGAGAAAARPSHEEQQA